MLWGHGASGGEEATLDLIINNLFVASHALLLLMIIIQSLKNSKVNRILAQFDVTLGARVNSVPTTDQGEATKGQHIITGSNVNGPGLNGPHKTVGGCGLTSLVSSPTENYTFYAKTAMRTPCK